MNARGVWGCAIAPRVPVAPAWSLDAVSVNGPAPRRRLARRENDKVQIRRSTARSRANAIESTMETNNDQPDIQTARAVGKCALRLAVGRHRASQRAVAWRMRRWFRASRRAPARATRRPDRSAACLGGAIGGVVGVVTGVTGVLTGGNNNSKADRRRRQRMPSRVRLQTRRAFKQRVTAKAAQGSKATKGAKQQPPC